MPISVAWQIYHLLIIIYKDGELKLGDFGLARPFGIPVRCYSAEVCYCHNKFQEKLLSHALQLHITTIIASFVTVISA